MSGSPNLELMRVVHLETGNTRYYQNRRNYHTQHYTPPLQWVRISKREYDDTIEQAERIHSLYTTTTRTHARHYTNWS